jgi:hypothetical protein
VLGFRLILEDKLVLGVRLILEDKLVLGVRLLLGVRLMLGLLVGVTLIGGEILELGVGSTGINRCAYIP